MFLKAYINRLDGTPLFRGISRELFEPLLSSISAKTEYYKKGEAIVQMGGDVPYIGVLLSGEAVAQRILSNGQTSILEEIYDGELFGEVFACVGTAESPIKLLATENSAVLLFEYQNLMTLQPELAAAQMTMISNLMRIMARKNLLTQRKLEILTKRTIRDKMLTFLQIQSDIAESDSFAIPYNRESLSEYLCVDRSALSRELCKLQDEGIITFKKNVFTLYRVTAGELAPVTAAM